MKVKESEKRIFPIIRPLSNLETKNRYNPEKNKLNKLKVREFDRRQGENTKRKKTRMSIGRSKKGLFISKHETNQIQIMNQFADKVAG